MIRLSLRRWTLRCHSWLINPGIESLTSCWRGSSIFLLSISSHPTLSRYVDSWQATTTIITTLVLSATWRSSRISSTHTTTISRIILVVHCRSLWLSLSWRRRGKLGRLLRRVRRSVYLLQRGWQIIITSFLLWSLSTTSWHWWSPNLVRILLFTSLSTNLVKTSIPMYVVNAPVSYVGPIMKLTLWLSIVEYYPVGTINQMKTLLLLLLILLSCWRSFNLLLCLCVSRVFPTIFT